MFANTAENMETDEIKIPISEGNNLKGVLTIPSGANAIVIFSHGSGDSRLSRKNNELAEILNKEKIATLLTDLLTEQEDISLENSFNTDLLVGHLTDITKAVMERPDLQHFKIGYFGAATGAGAALKAAAGSSVAVHAIVSRGGRPNLSKEELAEVKVPTLLMVGGLDDELIGFNQWAFNALQCEKKLEIVEGASHLLEESGKLNEVGRLATGWFAKYLHPDFLLTP